MDIDWPDLLAGFVLGVLGSLPFWLVERKRGRRETGAEWTRAARRIEKLTWSGEVRGDDIHALTQEMPLDHWRAQLGPADFQLLEQLQGAYWTAEHAAAKHAQATRDFYAARGAAPPRLQPEVHQLAFMSRVDPDAFLALPLTEADRASVAELQRDPTYEATEAQLATANLALHTVRTDFANMARARDRAEYGAVLRAERRRSAIRHPIRALRSRRVRRPRQSQMK